MYKYLFVFASFLFVSDSIFASAGVTRFTAAAPDATDEVSLGINSIYEFNDIPRKYDVSALAGKAGIIALDIDEVLYDSETGGPKFPDMVQQINDLKGFMTTVDGVAPLIVCLTARGYSAEQYTMHDLNSIGIYAEAQELPEGLDEGDVVRLSVPIEKTSLIGESCGFAHGVIYCYDTDLTEEGDVLIAINKGRLLRNFCSILKYYDIPFAPYLVFADDQMENLHSVALTDYMGLLETLYLFHVEPFPEMPEIPQVNISVFFEERVERTTSRWAFAREDVDAKVSEEVVES